MIKQQLRAADDWASPATRLHLIRESARILAARPVDTWRTAFDRLSHRLHLSPGILDHEVIHHSLDRDRDPAAYSQARISEIQERARSRKLHWDTAPTPSAGTTATRGPDRPAPAPQPERGHRTTPTR